MERKYTAWGIMRALLIAQFMLIVFGVVAAFSGPLNPPARYSHPFQGKLFEQRLSPKQVPYVCAALRRQWRIMQEFDYTERGCTVRFGSRCWIVYIDRPNAGRTPAQVRKHEVAHCNGWSWSHPD